MRPRNTLSLSILRFLWRMLRKIRLHYLFPFFFMYMTIVSVYHPSSSSREDESSYRAHVEPYIEPASVNDTINNQRFSDLAVHQLSGFRVMYFPGRWDYYFEYNTDHHELLKVIGKLPFNVFDEKGDLACRPIPKTDAESGQQIHSSFDNVLSVTASFRNTTDENFAYYECIKGNKKHVLFLSLDSDRVLHRIEVRS
jgi:hypothetical protein